MSWSPRDHPAVTERADALSELGPLAAPGSGRRLAPFFVVVAMTVASLPFNPGVNTASTVFYISAAALAMAAMLWLPWRRYPRWTQAAMGLAALLLIAGYMRTDKGVNSHLLGLILVPLIWFALYELRQYLYIAIAVAAALLSAEMVPLPPADDVLRVVVLLAVALVLLPGIRRLVADQRVTLAVVTEKSAELRYLALHDGLTGLANRALILDRLEQILARVRRDGGQCAVLFLDLDGFKEVNDTLGHQAGDTLLQAVAARLSSTLREVDTAGRLGGDEFVVVLDCSSSPQAAELLAQRVLDVLRQPFTLASDPDTDSRTRPVTMTVTASVGIALGRGEGGAELIRAADIALYHAKTAGKDRYEVFRPDLRQEQRPGSVLDTELRAAREKEQFRLVYQPIYNLDDLTLVGVEALIRWQHPTRGELAPQEFLAALESSGEIIEVGRWVLVQACAQMAQWRTAGSDLSVSVNVSARQLEADSIIDAVRDALTASGMPATALTLEITETALMHDLDAIAGRLNQLKELGVHIALDDFGTGYSSLAYLQHFPVDSLKIDRTFIDAISRTRDSDAIIRTLVQLGNDLGVSTVAEGVETPQQLDHVRRQGVDEVQGFLLAKPLDAETLDRLILQPVRSRPARPTPSHPASTACSA